ncbi:hypothetical protein EZY14_014290 [Kordia sp. TARA_039_SRF]|nr:hypothetical protein EZY14_014290 [Kordia sp. TARA_039_SRF]
MKTVTNIKEILIASALLIVLALPSCIQFSHQLEEEHEFTICLEQNDHVHENAVHCDICDFHFTSFYFEFLSYQATILTPIISQTTIGSTTPLCYYLPRTNTQLRAPPTFS